MRDSRELFLFESSSNVNYPYDYSSNWNDMGINLNRKDGIQLWIDKWYVSDSNVNHGTNLELYMNGIAPLLDIYHIVSNPYRISSDGTPQWSDPNSPHNGWTLGKYTPGEGSQVPWFIPNTFFVSSQSAFEAILRSGSGSPYSNKYEQIAFQIWRQVSAGSSSTGDQFIRRKLQVKPTNKISVTPNTVGRNNVVSSYDDFSTFELNFQDNINNYIPESVRYQYYKIEIYSRSTSSMVKTYYEKRGLTFTGYSRIDANNVKPNYSITLDEWDLPKSDYEALAPGEYQLQFTPGILYNGTFYSYALLSSTVTFVKDPVPKPNGFDATIPGTVRNMSATFFYTFPKAGYGVLNKLKLELVGGNSGEIVIPLLTTTSTARYSGNVTIDMRNLIFSYDYKLRATLYYNDSDYSTKEIENFIKSYPQPLQRPSNFQYDVTNKTAAKFSWFYDNSDQVRKGIANGFTVEFIDIDNVVVGTVNIDGLSYNTHGASFTYDLTNLKCFGKMIKVRITPKFTESIGYPYKMAQTINGNNPYESSYIFDVEFGLSFPVMIAPEKNVDAQWFSGDDYSHWKVAFILPVDGNYQYMTEAQKAAYLYKSLEVTYQGASTIKKVYDYEDRANQNWICVSGDGRLTYKNSVIVDLTDVIDPGTGDILEPDASNKYKVSVSIESPSGSSTWLTTTITVVDFPIIESNYTGSYITPDKFNQLVDASLIVNSYINEEHAVPLPGRCESGQLITYDLFANLLNPITYFYNKTQDWVNEKKFISPITFVGSEFVAKDEYLSYKGIPSGKDKIYGVQPGKGGTIINPLENLPENYSTKYNDYFQKSEDYVFRSRTNSTQGYINVETYIRSKVEATHLSVNDYDAYIAVPDKNLYANYKYEIDWRTKCGSSSEFAYGVGTVIGGSYYIQEDTISSYDVQRAYGIFVGVRYGSQEVLALSSCMEGHIASNVPIHYNVPEMEEHPTGDPLNARHITTFKLSDPVDPNLRTTNGFCLFQGMDYRTGAALNGNEHQYPATCPFAEIYGVVYSVKVYDSEDNLIMHFVPRTENGHIGMLDLIDTRFYPCNDDSKFEIVGSGEQPGEPKIYRSTTDDYNAMYSYYTLFKKLAE